MDRGGSRGMGVWDMSDGMDEGIAVEIFPPPI